MFNSPFDDFEDRDAITMSDLPAPTASNFGPLYKIPKTHCNIKRIYSDNSYDQPANRSEVDTDGMFEVLPLCYLYATYSYKLHFIKCNKPYQMYIKR